MFKQTNQIRIRRPVFILIILIVTLVIATPVLADYLGPDRVRTESHVEMVDYGVWAKDDPGYPDNPTCDHSGGSDCIVCEWDGSPGRACGDAEYSYTLGSRAEVVTTRIVLPPATITGTLQNCTLQNGWCVSLPELFINSKEPLAGYSIITIEGTLNGEVFACADTTCNVPLQEGNNSFTYWAISSWGDSSIKGVFAQRVDTVAPDVGLDIIGSNGTNGWYVSQTTLTATGADSTSGLYETLLSVAGDAWQPSAVLSDGVYDIAVRAIDNAGNISNSPATISVDTTTPSLNVSLSGTPGEKGWYVSKVKASAIASDATSGVATLEFSADGGAYQNYNSPISFSDGHHTYQFKTVDNAGNVTESPLQEVFVDTTFPAISLTEELSLGDTFYYDVQDTGSKLATIRVVIEDEDERFPKVTWQESLSGEKFKDEILWDGKFKDGVLAPAGTYYVTIKATDSAGNESIRAGAVKVELLSFLKSIPTFTPPTSQGDPEEISSVDQNPSTTPLSTGFGGTTTQSTGTTSQSLLLSADISSSSPSTSSPSNVLWGGVALAVIGAATAYALEENRKRKAAEAEQLRQAEAEAEQLNAAETARKAQEWQDGQNILNQLIETAQAQGATAAEISALEETGSTQGLGVAIASAENLNQSLQQEGLNAYYEARKQGEADAAQKVEDAEKLAELQAGLAAYYAGMKAGEAEAAITTVPSEAETSWWSSAWNSAVNWIDEKVYQPYIQPNFSTKNVVATLLTVALGYNGVQWVNNVVSNSDIFLPAQAQAEVLIEELSVKHPPAPENTTLKYLFTHPYEVFSTGSDVLNTLTSIGASYADTVWQQNPLVQNQIESLESLENLVCRNISDQGWSNRCTAAFYLPAALTATPFDTALGVINGFIVDPISGVVKQAGISIENYEALPDLVSAMQQDGIQGAQNFIAEILQKNLAIILNDNQIQSALFFEALIFLSLIAAPVAGGIILGMTAKGLIDLNTAVTAAQDKESLIEFINSHGVRTMVVSSILILALMTAGVGKQFSDFRAFQESLTPAEQAFFAELSVFEQTSIADMAIKMNLPPGALEFYLTESASPASPLAELSLADAFRVSSLAVESGKSAFILDYISRYGVTDALKIASPEVINGMVNDNILVQTEEMLNTNTGFNVSPEQWFTDFESIGRNGTFITNEVAIEALISKFDGQGKIQISIAEATALEEALGLTPESLSGGFRISKIINIKDMNPVFPVEANNPYFLGPGKGLPGGGPELIVTPSLPMNSTNIVQQVIIEVIP